MRSKVTVFTIFVMTLINTAQAGGSTWGPTPYFSFTDSPFNGLPFTYFHLDNFESGTRTPGYTISAGTRISGISSDSVDADDGIINGSGVGYYSLYAGVTNQIVFTFNSSVLGSLPTHAGIVWTDVVDAPIDHYGDVVFTAYDQFSNVIETIGPVLLGDGSGFGQTAEDRFFGIYNSGGIASISITMPESSDFEVDHLQYGFASAPSTGIGPSPYLSFSDSPFRTNTYDYFHLDNFEAAERTPGYTILNGTRIAGVSSDSVDADDGLINGTGVGRYSLYAGVSNEIIFVFNQAALGRLPTHVGIVWTDVVDAPITHYGEVIFRAYDQSSNMIVEIGPATLGDGTGYGQTDEDRFFGAVSLAGGISRISITMPDSIDFEVDHLQYGAQGSMGAGLGPSRYQSFHDSPFNGLTFDYFHLDDYESSTRTPGYSLNVGTRTAGVSSDSVDADDGIIDGSGVGRYELYAVSSNTINVVFDPSVLGELPTHAGIVWTDVVDAPVLHYGDVVFGAYDADSNLIAQIGPVYLGDGSGYGETAEDRFFGVIHSNGIRSIFITMPDSVDFAVDHLQYGRTSSDLDQIWPQPSVSGSIMNDSGIMDVDIYWTIPNRLYLLEFSSDLVSWMNSQNVIQGGTALSIQHVALDKLLFWRLSGLD